MEKRLVDLIRKGFEQKQTIDEIKHQLLSHGNLEKDVVEGLNQVSKEIKGIEVKKKRSLSSYFLSKEILDRVGYGFGAEQFINILFFHTGASYFLIGIINGLKAIISVLFSTFFTRYTETKEVDKKTIARFGILFGFSFLLIAIARFIHNIPLFIVAVLLGTVSVVSHGDLYQKLISDVLRKEKRSGALRKIGFYGVLILAASMLLSGFLMDLFPATGKLVNIFGTQIRIYGYLISFEITAFAFIVSGFILSFIKEKPKQKVSIAEEFQNFYFTLKHNTIKYLKNKTILILLIAATITGFTQTIGYSYYGLYIFQIFNKVYLKGFLNVAVIFLAAALFSLMSPGIARNLSKRYGKIPMLVFGTVLLSIMPFTFYYNPTIFTIAAGTVLSIIGSSLVGLATGLMLSDLVHKKERKIYYSTFSLIMTVPYIITVPIGAWFAQNFGARVLFFYLGLILLIIVAPLYFILLFIKREAVV
ncbi:MFS transporter [Candidatus Woesearchaeota archaeon]|nr:MFS transporter [Candidatus Woesearchaeota archaeon]MBW3021290.1 MFS transporter [Candidatus Woesearchaeota archaeon]